MGNTKQTCNQSSCSSSKKGSNKVTDSSSTCCSDVTIETSCNVGVGSTSCNVGVGSASTCRSDIQARRDERLDRRRSRRGR